MNEYTKQELEEAKTALTKSQQRAYKAIMSGLNRYL